MTTLMPGAAPMLRPAQGLAYGLLGLPLAFVALPLYVHLPAHYAGLGVPLAQLGVLLLAVRALDAVVDPLIGRAADRLLGGPAFTRWAVAAAAALLLSVAFQALFFPAVAGSGTLLAWAAAALAGCYLGYSGLGVLHQAWGARLGGAADFQARVVAWREGASLAGVIAASVLPGALGLQATSAVLAAALALALWALRHAPAPGVVNTPASAGVWAPWRAPRFRRLLLIFMLNGVASALPATLVLFYIRDRLQWPAGEPLLLGLYFAAAAVSLPVWVRVVARLGLARAWLVGMGLAIAGFAGAAFLGAGDGPWFALVCMASGAALGADLCAPAALLAGVLHAPGRNGEPGSHDAPPAAAGVAFGWWNAATKLNLALAAGLALPLLQWLGYQPGSAGGGNALALVYAVLPCALKALAAAALWQLWIRPEEHTT
jgi:glycoside/pentoside/hexuronide:cation symporter, GPH family